MNNRAFLNCIDDVQHEQLHGDIFGRDCSAKPPISKISERKNTLYPPHGQNRNHGVSCGFTFPFSAGFQGKCGSSFGKKVVLAFGFEAIVENKEVMRVQIITVLLMSPDHKYLTRGRRAQADKRSPDLWPERLDSQILKLEAPEVIPYHLNRQSFPFRNAVDMLKLFGATFSKF